jgi:hypothetical protein
MYDVPMPTDKLCDATVTVLGPPEAREYEIAVWDAEEAEWVHGLTLTEGQALSVFEELRQELVDAGLILGRSTDA